MENSTWLWDKSILFQPSNNWLPKFMQRYNFTKNKDINKKLKELEEIRLIYQLSHSYFCHTLLTHYWYLFDTNKPRQNYGSSYHCNRYLLGQVSLHIVIGLDEIWYIKGSHGNVFISHTGSGYDKNFPLLNYAYAIMEYNQILQSSFG